MAFDSGIITFTTKTDKVDLVSAAHINAVQAELVIVETILGVGVKGSAGSLSSRLGATMEGTQSSLANRLAKMMDSDGSLLSGSSFPSPSLPSQPFYRTDLDSFYIMNAAGSQWNQFGNSLSNVLFNFGSGERVKYYTNTTTTPPAAPTNTIQMWGSDSSSTYLTVITTRFKKIPGVSTLTLYIGLVSRNGGGTTKARVTVNSAGVVSGDASSSAGAGVVNWVTTTADVSGLVNGTVYDMNIDIYSDATAGIGSAVGGIIFGS